MSVLSASNLGFVFESNVFLSKNFEVLHSEVTSFDETLLNSKCQSIRLFI
jgi:hypothetical protein